MSADRAETIALWRHSLIAEAARPRLAPAERGRLVRLIAARPHEDADGRPCTVSRNTLDRWLRAYCAIRAKTDTRSHRKRTAFRLKADAVPEESGQGSR